jgi:hypothetical protein
MPGNLEPVWRTRSVHSRTRRCWPCVLHAWQADAAALEMEAHLRVLDYMRRLARPE